MPQIVQKFFLQLISDKYLQALIYISDTFHAHKNFPSSRMPLKLSEIDDGTVLSHETNENVNGEEVYGLGLKNEVGEYNCFLNVIIQVRLFKVLRSWFPSDFTIYNLIFGHLF